MVLAAVNIVPCALMLFVVIILNYFFIFFFCRRYIISTVSTTRSGLFSRLALDAFADNAFENKLRTFRCVFVCLLILFRLFCRRAPLNIYIYHIPAGRSAFKTAVRSGGKPSLKLCAVRISNICSRDIFLNVSSLILIEFPG